MLILLSPAKNLDYETQVPTKRKTKAALLEHSERLAQQLKRLSPQKLSKLMGISDKLGVLNYDRYQKWQTPFKTPEARQAMFAFSGDVYQGLDAYTFDNDAIDYAQQHIRILSGLYGLLRPLDLIAPYRLEMGTGLKNDAGKDLYAFWGTTLADKINRAVANTESQVVINLASQEYFKAARADALKAPVITPVFKDWKNGQYKIISFFAKKARGLMTAYSCEEALTDPEDLKAFDRNGYRFNAAMSSDTEWVFTRKE